MDLGKQFKRILDQTQVLKSPKHRLATFGQTKINYYFLSEVAGFKDRSRMREGEVIAESPKLITPDFLRNRFEGFGSQSKEFARWLAEKYGGAFQGLEYKFRNESKSTRIEYTPVKPLGEELSKRLRTEEYEQCAIIQGRDKTWQISLMKFIVDECLSSFAENVRELDEHGYFGDPEKPVKDRRGEIEKLFEIARKNPTAVRLLGNKLHRYGLFKEYEDRFFQLIKS